jgi:small subunit ribosomal protein S26e
LSPDATRHKYAFDVVPRPLEPLDEQAQVKRRNHGRNRHGRNHTRQVLCDGCACKPAKDKAIKRFTVRNIVDKSSLRDLTDACIIENYELPKFYIKIHYCVSCAVHRKIVRPRSKVTRSIRTNPRQAIADKFREQRDKPAAGGPGGAAPQK